MKPTKSILDETFRYTNAANTDIRRTFARIRREQRATKEQEAKDRAEAQAKTASIQAIFARRRG